MKAESRQIPQKLAARLKFFTVVVGGCTFHPAARIMRLGICGISRDVGNPVNTLFTNLP